MRRLNNKGQSLIMFVLFLPVLIGFVALVVDVGEALTKKKEIDNVIEFVLDYGLDNLEDVSNEKKDDVLDNELDSEVIENTDIEEKENIEDKLVNVEETLEVLLTYNLKNVDTDVVIQDGVIFVFGEIYVDGIFSNILNIKGFKIESEYQGYIENGDKVIEKVK